MKGALLACLKLLLNEKLGLSALYPNNIIHLMSTAEVERVVFIFILNIFLLLL
jgi:hypothetical protein